MERAGHRGRGNKKAAVGTILLLMCFFGVALLQPSEEKKCPEGDYLSKNEICCDMCNPGHKLVEECHAQGHRSICTVCPDDQYMENRNYSPNCRSCRRCKKPREIEVAPCTKTHNTICKCIEGYYKHEIDGETYECRKCKKCGSNEKEKQRCTSQNDTVCECQEKYYRVKSKCEPCKSCTTKECSHLCTITSTTTMATKAPDKPSGYHIIAGVVTMAVVLLFVVFLITHLATKKFTKRKLQKQTLQPSDVSPDSCKEILTFYDSPSSTVKDAPQSPVNEQQSLNLPDCVPLEFKIPDLIYTVLDLVPVLQVKQLVRTLGVKDTEIEQAEMDHRYCREAHYQMLRVWAERECHAGERGQGGMLHQSLMEELLDNLRKMHLGRTAEELEKKYGIQ